MVNISPSVERSLVTRSVTSSTVPRASSVTAAMLNWTRSPKPYCFSVMMKKPAQQVLHHALRAETERGAQHRGRRDQ